LVKEVQQENKETKPRGIQDYLSLGYLYLLVLGIFKDALYYGHLGINIINYASVQDILLSPIIHLTSDIKRFLIFFVGIPLIALGIGYVAKKYHDTNKNKDWYRAKKNFEKWDKQYDEENTKIFFISVMLFAMFGAFIGFGLGSGQKKAEKLSAQKLEMNHQITFADNKILKVNLLGHNSEYLFYAAENDTTVTIVPIQGNIKKIENLE